MKKFFLLFALFLSGEISAQTVTTRPVVPVQNKPATLVFHADRGTAGLKGYTGTVYIHIGVITNLSNNDTDWKYVHGNWGTNPANRQMTHISGDIWEFEITPNVRAFFGVADGENIERLAMVFYSGEKPGGNWLEGKDVGGQDIFVDVSDADFNVKMLQPTNNTMFVEGAPVNFFAQCSDSANLSIVVNGNVIETAENDTIIAASASFTKGTYVAKVIAQLGDKTQTDSVFFAVRGETETAALPTGLKDGINYYNDDKTKVTFVLSAPHKSHIFVVGDFNNWRLSPDYQMKRHRDNRFAHDPYWANMDDRYWLTIDGLTPGKEYAFQYIIDDTIFTTDPFAEKVL
ncbi:MAG: Por secretion system protein, partial [Bacteroidales bacterium]|nr:Por secretion system protein [Bacteroidales bacterium]